MDVHITRAGKKIGIFNSDLLQELITHGVVRPDDQAWIEGAANSQAVKEMFPNLDVPTPKAAVSQQAKRQKTATTRIPTLQTFESTQATESPSSSTTEVAASSLARTVPVTGLALVNNWSSPAKASVVRAYWCNNGVFGGLG